MRILVINRPAIIESNIGDLDREFRAARWTHHRILDFEEQHQEHMDQQAELCAPGIRRVARLVSKLRGRIRRKERSTGWSPPLHDDWLSSLSSRLLTLRKQRDTDPRWKSAVRWGDSSDSDAPARGGARRKPGETDGQFTERNATRRTTLTRREAHRAKLYAERTVYWGTWNGLLKQVDQARSMIIKRRKEGLPADWHRPRWDNPCTLYADTSGLRVHRDNGKHWAVEMRLFEGWAKFRLSSHGKPFEDFDEIRTVKLTRRKNGSGWSYSVSITVAGALEKIHPGQRIVALDGGFRERGHPSEHHGIRAFAWLGEDGKRGEVLLPDECRQRADMNQRLLSKLALDFNEIGLPYKTRHHYRSALMRSGVRTELEQAWLSDERRVERRVEANRKRIVNLREEAYRRAINELRQRYGLFIFEDTSGQKLRKIGTEEQAPRRQRQNRDMVAEYTFRQLCERSGAEAILVSARNSTRECPACGELTESSSKLLIKCRTCGTVRDQDFGAAQVLLKRAQGALAKQIAS